MTSALAGSRLIERVGDDHDTLSLRLDGLADDVVAWFDGASFESGGP